MSANCAAENTLPTATPVLAPPAAEWSSCARQRVDRASGLATWKHSPMWSQNSSRLALRHPPFPANRQPIGASWPCALRSQRVTALIFHRCGCSSRDPAGPDRPGRRRRSLGCCRRDLASNQSQRESHFRSVESGLLAVVVRQDPSVFQLPPNQPRSVSHQPLQWQRCPCSLSKNRQSSADSSPLPRLISLRPRQFHASTLGSD